ncbi:hypothetical protein D3C77_514960 [compost metagenome]
MTFLLREMFIEVVHEVTWLLRIPRKNVIMQWNNGFGAYSHGEFGSFPIIHVPDNTALPPEIIRPINGKQSYIRLNGAHLLYQFRKKHRIASMV